MAKETSKNSKKLTEKEFQKFISHYIEDELKFYCRRLKQDRVKEPFVVPEKVDYIINLSHNELIFQEIFKDEIEGLLKLHSRFSPVPFHQVRSFLEMNISLFLNNKIFREYPPFLLYRLYMGQHSSPGILLFLPIDGRKYYLTDYDKVLALVKDFIKSLLPSSRLRDRQGELKRKIEIRIYQLFTGGSGDFDENLQEIPTGEEKITDWKKIKKRIAEEFGEENANKFITGPKYIKNAVKRAKSYLYQQLLVEFSSAGQISSSFSHTEPVGRRRKSGTEYIFNVTGEPKIEVWYGDRLILKALPAKKLSVSFPKEK